MSANGNSTGHGITASIHGASRAHRCRTDCACREHLSSHLGGLELKWQPSRLLTQYHITHITDEVSVIALHYRLLSMNYPLASLPTHQPPFVAAGRHHIDVTRGAKLSRDSRQSAP